MMCGRGCRILLLCPTILILLRLLRLAPAPFWSAMPPTGASVCTKFWVRCLCANCIVSDKDSCSGNPCSGGVPPVDSSAICVDAAAPDSGHTCIWSVFLLRAYNSFCSSSDHWTLGFDADATPSGVRCVGMLSHALLTPLCRRGESLCD